MKPQERIRSAVSKAQAIIARYIHPGRRDCEEAVNELAEVLDDEKVVQAMEEAKEAAPADQGGDIRKAS